MKNENPVVKYMHFQIDDKRFLSVATSLNREDNTLKMGYTVSSPKDRYDRKIGNHLAYAAMCLTPIMVKIPDENLIFHRFMSWYTLEHIFLDMMKNEKTKRYPENVLESLESLCDEQLEGLKMFLMEYFDEAFEELRSSLFLDTF